MPSTTQGNIYFTALSSLEKLEVQFVPKALTLDRRASIGSIAVVGRNNPLHHYTGGDTTLKFDLDFYSEEVNREDVIRKCRWLESMANSDGFDSPQERLRLTFGDMFKADEIWLIKGLSIKYDRFSSAHRFLPVQAYVSITLVLDTDYNRRVKDIQWT